MLADQFPDSPVGSLRFDLVSQRPMRFYERVAGMGTPERYARYHDAAGLRHNTNAFLQGKFIREEMALWRQPSRFYPGRYADQVWTAGMRFRRAEIEPAPPPTAIVVTSSVTGYSDTIRRDMEAAMTRRAAGTLAGTFLEGMPEWLETGQPPPWLEFTRHGYTDDWRRPMRMHYISDRSTYIRKYGFSLPSAEAVEALKALGPIVEVAAGSGYWAKLLHNAGCNIAATDINAHLGNNYAFALGAHFPVLPLSAIAASRRFIDRAVFCSWPDYDLRWPANFIKRLQPGRVLALIGEGPGGCTGDDRMHDILERDFEVIGQPPIPQFPCIHDQLTIYRKVRA